MKEHDIIRYGRRAVLLNILGVVFSGLVFPVYSALFHPQPEWKDAEQFVEYYHPVQTVTFYFGYLLITGSLFTFIALTGLAKDKHKIHAISALVVHSVFAAIVFLNYIIQTTYVPYLATNNPPEAEYVLAAFSMANPGSFVWALEMWGWGGIGLSYLLMVPVFGSSRMESVLKVLFIVNGVASLISAFLTSINMNWLFSMAGFAALIIWNLLVLIIDVVLLRYFKEIDSQYKVM